MATAQEELREVATWLRSVSRFAAARQVEAGIARIDELERTDAAASKLATPLESSAGVTVIRDGMTAAEVRRRVSADRVLELVFEFVGQHADKLEETRLQMATRGRLQGISPPSLAMASLLLVTCVGESVHRLMVLLAHQQKMTPPGMQILTEIVRQSFGEEKVPEEQKSGEEPQGAEA